jgi:hypothetical protein
LAERNRDAKAMEAVTADIKAASFIDLAGRAQLAEALRRVS